MKIYLENQQKKLKLNFSLIKKLVKKVLIKERNPALPSLRKEELRKGGVNPALRSFRNQDLTKSGVNIIFVDNLKIVQFNKKYLRRNSPTDVLAFGMQEGFPLEGNPYLLGDIIISVSAAINKARELKINPDQEIYLYVIHGLLHLLGYDDKSSKDKLIIRRKEREYLKLCRSKDGEL